MKPFSNVESAVFWVMPILAKRADPTPAICEPDTIVQIIDRLYRQRRMNFAHARVLRNYGQAQAAPARDTADGRLWREAIVALDTPLRVRGIVSSIEDNVIPFPQRRPADVHAD